MVEPVELEDEHHEPQLDRLGVGLFPGGVEVEEGVERALEGESSFVGFKLFEKPFEPSFGHFGRGWHDARVNRSLKHEVTTVSPVFHQLANQKAELP